MPVLISSFHNRGPCGFFSIHNTQQGHTEDIELLNPLAMHVFKRTVNRIIEGGRDGEIVIGEPLSAGARVIHSTDVSPESYFDRSAPLAGPAGLEDAERHKLLRKATAQDFKAWVEAMALNQSSSDAQPNTGKTIRTPSRHWAYVVVEQFAYPAGLFGGNSATFFIPQGVPAPLGDPGHSEVYDFNTMTCGRNSCYR